MHASFNLYNYYTLLSSFITYLIAPRLPNAVVASNGINTLLASPFATSFNASKDFNNLSLFELNYVDSDVWKQFEEYMHLLFGEDVDFIHASRAEEVYFTIESGIMNFIVMNKY